MGSNNSKVNIEYKKWNASYNYENTLHEKDRIYSLVSYGIDEKTSFGKIDLSKFNEKTNNEFELKEKGWNFVDGQRKSYSHHDDCCLGNQLFILKDQITYTCDPDTQNLKNHLCDDILYDHCVLNESDDLKCEYWIERVVENSKPIFNKIKEYCSREENRNKKIKNHFFSALRKFSGIIFEYNEIVDNIILSYPEEIRKEEYKCFFPNSEIIKEEERNSSVYKECWYKECVLAPIYKLSTKNISKRNKCQFTICDININELNISNNEIEIICQNKFIKNNINMEIDNPLIKDAEKIFFVPTYINTLVPFIILLSLLYI